MFPCNLIQSILDEAASVAKSMWHYGWAEGSAGNFSVNITKLIDSVDLSSLSVSESSLKKSYPLLENQYLLITASGARMREIPELPLNNLIVIKVINGGNKYQIIPLSINSKKNVPSSELQTHLTLHSHFIGNGMEENSIIHSHLTELIVLSHIPEYRNKISLNKILFGIHPEFSLFLPEGIGYLSFMESGNEEIAKQTLTELGKHKIVVWEKHGCISIGNSLNQAFDNQEILSKTCRIYLECCKTGMVISTGKL